MGATDIRLMVAYRRRLLREGLRLLLGAGSGIRIVTEASSGQEALARAASVQPEVVLLDLGFSGPDGLEVCRRLKEAWPDLKVVALSSSDDLQVLVRAVKAGASACYTRDVSAAELADSVRRVRQEGDRPDPHPANRLWEHLPGAPEGEDPGGRPGRGGPSGAGLTRREGEVLRLVAEGRTNREIGQSLGISENTVRNHITSILQKLQVRDRTPAAVVALKGGLIPIP